MSFLLDTNICSAHIRRPGGVAHSFIQHSGRLWMPTIVLAELYEQICDDPSVTKVLLVDRTRDLAKLSGSYLDLGTETGMRLVLNEVFRSVSRCRHTKNTENSAWGLCLSRPEPNRRQDAIAVCRVESFISGAGRSSATAAVGQPVVENARHGGDQSRVIALAGGTAGELDGSRQRSFDHEGIRPSAGEHRERTTIRQREACAGNGKRFWAGADCSSARPPRESERIGERGDKFTTRILSGGQIRKQINRVAVSVPRPGIRPGLDSIQRLD